MNTTTDNTLPQQWVWQNQTCDSILKHVEWLQEPRKLGSGCDYHFLTTGKLLHFTLQDYMLIVPTLQQAILGLERAIRVHYKPVDECYGSLCNGCTTVSFRDLLQKAVDNQIINDEIFSKTPPHPDGLKEQIQNGTLFSSQNKDEKSRHDLSYSQQLATLIPILRNYYFHGNPTFLCPGFLDVIIDLRLIADALKTRGVRSLLF